jgi:DNA-directed RNA polymerase specialized sigma24 family protein
MACYSGRINAPVARNQEIFDRFLLRLDPDRNKAGEQYENIRRKLIKFFQWRECEFPEDHADEVMQRMIGKIEQGEDIQNPFSYCYGVARMVLLEIRKNRVRQQRAVEELGRSQPSTIHQLQTAQAVECLNRCLQTLSAENMSLILKYYEEERGTKIENRRRLAEDLSIPLNALRIRAHRLRETLEMCVQKCLEKQKE